MKWQRIHCLLVKELAQIRRDRKLLAMLVIAPVFQLVILGFAASTDIREITIGIRDRAHTPESREFVRALGSSGYFKPFYLTGAAQEEDAALVYGKAGVVLVIPQDFSRRLQRGESPEIQALVDGTDSNFGIQGLNYLLKAAHQFAAGQSALHATWRGPAVRIESRVWYNPDLRSQMFMIPALMGMLLMVATMLVTSMALVKEREEGTMEQLIVTPLSAGEIIAGKLLPFALIGLVMSTLALLVIVGLFQVPLRGSVPLLYGFTLLFILTTLSLGLLLSTLVHTQQQAMFLAAFFVMLPSIMLSGFVFPVENMPPPIQWLAAILPLKYYLTALRGIFLKGASALDLWREALFLLAWGVVVLGLAVLRFRKRLD